MATATRPPTRPRLHRVAWALVLAIVAELTVFAAPDSVTVLRGEIDGAPYAVARPADWNKNLLLLAHGLRPEDAPLEAKLDPGDPAYARLLDEGWIVATTAFRRNGMIVRDAIADLHALRDHLAATEGAPRLTLLMGDSMGGAIVTLIAENEPVRYQGAVAVGAALQSRDPEYPLALTAEPKIPVIFLTNGSELEGPAAYVARAARAPVPPALWTIGRDGHVNVNGAERAAALEGLITWITANAIERTRDATVAASGIASTARFENGAARGRVTEVTDGYGNLFSSFVPADFETLAIKPGTVFELEIHGRTFRVTFGTDFGAATRGAWVAFPRAEGVILFAINRGNAAQAADAHEGDALVIRPVDAK